MTEIDPNYHAHVANAAMTAIIDLYGDETGQSGVIEPVGAIDGLCLAIAMIAHNVGKAETKADRRKLADECRKRVLMSSNAIVLAQQRGELPEWVQAKPVTHSS